MSVTFLPEDGGESRERVGARGNINSQTTGYQISHLVLPEDDLGEDIQVAEGSGECPPALEIDGCSWMFKVLMGSLTPIEAHWSKNVFSKP